MKTSPLNNIKIASPCSANWDEMNGDDKKRFCGSCQLNVYNLSGMTKIEAEKLLMDSEGKVCVRFYKRADGTVLTQDCPVGWAKVKRNLTRAATAVFSLIIGLFGGIFAFNISKTSNKTSENSNSVNANINLKIEADKEILPPAIMGNVATMGTPTPIQGKAVVKKNKK